jgi:uncharacterized protein (DUF302 family)
MSPTSLIFGLLAGMILTIGAMVVIMRTYMIQVYKSPLGLEATIEKLEQAIRDAGWKVPGSERFNETLAKGNVAFPHRVHLIKLCEPHLAAEVLADSREMACMMPCTFAVFEDDQGAVRISKINTQLMGKMFGGTIDRVMGGRVASDGKAMLKAILGA